MTVNPELAQLMTETRAALRHAQQLYGTATPTTAPRLRRRRNLVRRVRRKWRQPAGNRTVSASRPNPSDKRSVARYIYDSARARGYSPHDATAVVAYSIGESGLNPTISGGVQGDGEVIGLFQEKVGFAQAGGVDPAARYTVEGNTTAYLNQLDKHTGGDIFQRLLHTSVGGPMYTGGYSAMNGLMSQASELLGTGTN